jgi:hypothetical protein
MTRLTRPRIGVIVIAGGLLALAACSARPLSPEQLRAPGLGEIHTAFERTVRTATASPDAKWRSGWWGNLRVHLGGDDARGLCYEWQGLVYGGVIETVRRIGWEATGVSINQGTASEHHAVVVYDPRRIRQEDLLKERGGGAAFVLDAWRRGEPDVFPLDVWLDLPMLVRVAPRLEHPYPGFSGPQHER